MLTKRYHLSFLANVLTALGIGLSTLIPDPSSTHAASFVTRRKKKTFSLLLLLLLLLHSAQHPCFHCHTDVTLCLTNRVRTAHMSQLRLIHFPLSSIHFLLQEMGIPFRRLICASNVNNVLTEFFQTGCYNLTSRKLLTTASPAIGTHDMPTTNNYFVL